MKLTKIICLAVLIVCTLGVPGFAENKGVDKKIDLARTLTYIKGIEARDTFPDTPTFAYYSAYAHLAIEGKIGPGTATKIKEYLKTCIQEDGGCAANPRINKESNSIFTYFAIQALALTGGMDIIDRQKTTAFILSLVQPDGGIKIRTKDKTASLATTFYGVETLNLLKTVDRLDKKKTIAMINTYREKGLGFCMTRGKASRPQATYMAVKMLDTLGGMDNGTKKEIIAYLKGTRYSGLIKDKKYPGLPLLKEMRDVLAAFDILSAGGEIDSKAVYGFIKSLYINENGGFGPYPGLGTTPPSTYDGIFCLVRLGKLPDPWSGRRPINDVHGGKVTE